MSLRPWAIRFLSISFLAQMSNRRTSSIGTNQLLTMRPKIFMHSATSNFQSRCPASLTSLSSVTMRTHMCTTCTFKLETLLKINPTLLIHLQIPSTRRGSILSKQVRSGRYRQFIRVLRAAPAAILSSSTLTPFQHSHLGVWLVRTSFLSMKLGAQVVHSKDSRSSSSRNFWMAALTIMLNPMVVSSQSNRKLQSQVQTKF